MGFVVNTIRSAGKALFGGADAATEAARIQAGAATTAATTRATAATSASAARVAAQEKAIAEQRRQFEITRAQAEPFRKVELERLERGAGLREQQTVLGEARTAAAQQALTQRRALTGLSGVEAQREAMAGLEASPAQQFMRERQQQALLRSSAALGGLGGGQVRSELQQQAAGFASQDLQSQLQRLSAFGGSGMTGQVDPRVTLGLGAQRGRFAGAVSGALTGIGGARAGGLLGAGQARAGGILGAGGARAGGILGAQGARAGIASGLLGIGVGAGIGAITPGFGAGRGALAGLAGAF